jgi:hypothetical protein
MISCVVPQAPQDELYHRLADYPAYVDRRRQRPKGSFLAIEPPLPT